MICIFNKLYVTLCFHFRTLQMHFCYAITTLTVLIPGSNAAPLYKTSQLGTNFNLKHIYKIAQRTKSYIYTQHNTTPEGCLSVAATYPYSIAE